MFGHVLQQKKTAFMKQEVSEGASVSPDTVKPANSSYNRTFCPHLVKESMGREKTYRERSEACSMYLKVLKKTTGERTLCPEVLPICRPQDEGALEVIGTYQNFIATNRFSPFYLKISQKIPLWNVSVGQKRKIFLLEIDRENVVSTQRTGLLPCALLFLWHFARFFWRILKC